MVFRVVGYSTNSWGSPLARLRLVGPFEHAGINFIRGTERERIWPDQVEQADIVVIQRDFPRHQRAFQEILNRAKEANKPVVFELDDLIFDLPEHHPDRMNGIYADALLPMISAIMQVDAITVSTQLLAEFMHPLHSRVFVLPNNLDDKIWALRSPITKAEGPIVIGYMGGPSHAPDLHIVLPALINLAQQYGERIAFRFIGIEPPPTLADLAQVSWEPVTTMDYAQFAAEFRTETFDIAVAPLADNAFNRAKSNIKFLEYTALGVPGVYSALPPYADLMADQQNGLLAATCSEWEENLIHLIENPELRFNLATAAQQTVQNHHLLSRNAQCWNEVYEQVTQSSKRKPHELFATLQPLIEQVQMQLHTLERQSDTEKLYLAKREIRRLRADRDSFSRQLWQVQHDPIWQRISSVRNYKNRLFGQGDVTDLEASSLQDAGNKNQGFGKGLKLDGRISLGKPQPGKFDIFLFAIMDWETRIQRPQQLARQFAHAGYRVFYLRTKFHDGEHALIQPLEENIWDVCLPANHEVNVYQEALDLTLQSKLEVALSHLRDSFGVKTAVSLIHLPFWWPLARNLRASENWPVIYDCMDYHRGFSSNESAMLAEEEALMLGSDLVLVTSHLLQQQVEAFNPNCLLLPNGADFEHFKAPPSDDESRIQNSSEPVIGYFGAIADWFDTKLVRELALARPEWRFELIGSTLYGDIASLEGLPNVSLLGEKAYAQLPKNLHKFDVAIIPFKKTPLTEATNPVKLFEYLSAGKPVVATDLDELRHYTDFVRLAENSETWLEALDAALKENDPKQVRIRQDFARKNTWQARFAEAECRIQALFPLVSVIVLTYNNLDYTRQCLRSILDKTIYPNYEVIVVDNASSDATPAYLETLAQREPRVRLHLNTENVGFAAGNNQGARLAAGEILIFLNNDTVVPAGWMSGLVMHVQDPDVGMVGPVTNSSGNETCIEVPYQTMSEMEVFAANFTAAHRKQIFDISMLAFLCVAIRRSVYDEIGPLDEQFGVGMFEDDDYARRVSAKGYRIICAEDVFVHHWGSASFSRLEDENYRQIFEANRRKLEAKWGVKWKPHRGRNE